MANYRTHVSTSVMLGAAYGAVGHVSYGMPAPSAAIAAGLVAIGGILPDMDSDNAVVLRESLGIVAAVTPLLAFDRMSHHQLSQENMVFIAAVAYLAIRFLLGAILRNWTVHRGMWHSLPAAAIAGLVVFYLCSCPETEIRIFKSVAIVVGFLWHLLLDEIYAVETGLARVRLKRSFGTALKMWSSNPVANLVTYGLLVACTFLISQDRSIDLRRLKDLSIFQRAQATRPLAPPSWDERSNHQRTFSR